MFNVWDGGKVYVDVKGDFDESLFVPENIINFTTTPVIEDILEKLKNGKAILINVPKPLTADSIEMTTALINQMLIETSILRLENILFCFDELQSLGHISSLILALSSKTVFVASTIPYTRTLEEHYSTSEIEIIRNLVTMYDTEKQPIQ